MHDSDLPTFYISHLDYAMVAVAMAAAVVAAVVIAVTVTMTVVYGWVGGVMHTMPLHALLLDDQHVSRLRHTGTTRPWVECSDVCACAHLQPILEVRHYAHGLLSFAEA